MRLLSFLLYYCLLRFNVLLGRQLSDYPLGIGWRWRNWNWQRDRERQLREAEARCNQMQTAPDDIPLNSEPPVVVARTSPAQAVTAPPSIESAPVAAAPLPASAHERQITADSRRSSAVGQTTHYERRADDRAPVSLTAVCEGRMGRRSARISNISMGGCYIDTVGRIMVGEKLSFVIQTPDQRTLRLQGEVAYCHPTTGYGLRFTHLSEIDKNQIALLIDHTRSDKISSSNGAVL